MKRPWALVLSGGGARGVAHIGVLKALNAAGYPKPDMVAGTSMGAIVGGVYACGMSPEEMEDFAAGFNIFDYMDGFAFRIGGAVGKIFRAGQILANLAVNTGIEKGERLLDLFTRLSGGKTFEETKIPFRCNAVDLVTGREEVFRSGSVAKALRASMSFPGVFEPFVEDGHCYVDGGVLNNIPVSIPREEGIRRVLAVDVGSFREVPLESLNNCPQVLMRTMETSLNALKERDPRQPTLRLYASGGGDAFSFHRLKILLELGEKAVEAARRELDAFFGSGLRRFFLPKTCGLREAPCNGRA